MIENERKCMATILAIAGLRKKYPTQRNTWMMIIKKKHAIFGIILKAIFLMKV